MKVNMDNVLHNLSQYLRLLRNVRDKNITLNFLRHWNKSLLSLDKGKIKEIEDCIKYLKEKK